MKQLACLLDRSGEGIRRNSLAVQMRPLPTQKAISLAMIVREMAPAGDMA